MKKISKETWNQTKNFEPNEALEFTCVIPIIENWKGKNVLDFGCGSGRSSVRLALGGVNICAVDILESNIERAEKLFKENKVKGDFKTVKERQDIPYPDNFFDGIICEGVLHHIPHATEVVTEFNRVLKKEGVVYLMLYSADLFKLNLDKIINMIRNQPEKTWQRCFGEITDDCNYSDFYTISDMTSLFMPRGFSKLKVAPFNRGFFQAVKLSR